MVKSTWERRPGAAPRLVHVSAPAHQGGVTELLAGLIPAQAATGQSVGWALVDGDSTFFAFTRYLRHLLHGAADSTTADRLAEGAQHYRSTLAAQADGLAAELDPGDVVVLHDPQTLGMAPVLADAGLKVVWHCHVGTTELDASGPAAIWRTFGSELSRVDAAVSMLPEFVPQAVPPAKRHVIAPAVDPDSARNRDLSREDVSGLLESLGLTAAGTGDTGQVEQDQPLPDDAPVVLQLAPWEPLEDMPGVLGCLATLPSDTHLVLAGHDPDEVPDNTEGRAVFEAVRELRAEMPPAQRARVHLVLLSTVDSERAALTSNALQRRADVVLQKCLAEGLGLTVTEAMAKGRAVVAADVGGLRQQVSPGHNGLLVDPRDHTEVVEALNILLEDPLMRRRLGKHAAESVHRRYLMPRLVDDYRLFAVPGTHDRVREVA